MSEYGLTAKQLAEYLEEQGIGIVGQDLFYSFMPDSPGCLYFHFSIPAAGQKIRTLPRKDVTFSIPDSGRDLRRGPSLRLKTTLLLSRMGFQKSVLVSEVFLFNLFSRCSLFPYYMGRDENGRDEFVWNMTFHYQVKGCENMPEVEKYREWGRRHPLQWPADGLVDQGCRSGNYAEYANH